MTLINILRNGSYVVLALIVMLTGCSTSSASNRREWKARTTWRAPARNATPNISRFVQRGEASWYGDKFHGRRTANGERYNMHGFTAAHRTLPFGSYVRVTNLANGKRVVVRINDRGPFRSQRIIDLSHQAARTIGMTGTTQVEIRGLPPRR